MVFSVWRLTSDPMTVRRSSSTTRPRTPNFSVIGRGTTLKCYLQIPYFAEAKSSRGTEGDDDDADDGGLAMQSPSEFGKTRHCPLEIVRYERMHNRHILLIRLLLQLQAATDRTAGAASACPLLRHSLPSSSSRLLQVRLFGLQLLRIKHTYVSMFDAHIL
jgi:hypothetical protein